MHSTIGSKSKSEQGHSEEKGRVAEVSSWGERNNGKGGENGKETMSENRFKSGTTQAHHNGNIR